MDQEKRMTMKPPCGLPKSFMRKRAHPVLFDVRRTTASSKERTLTLSDTPPAQATRTRLRPRVKRGIVASYVHGLSQRHRTAPPAAAAQLADSGRVVKPADPTVPGLTT
jgi:hypothetical protein